MFVGSLSFNNHSLLFLVATRGCFNQHTCTFLFVTLFLQAKIPAGCVMNEAKIVLSAAVLDRELCAAPPSKMLGRGMFLMEANLMLPPSTPGGPSCWTRDDSWMLLPVHSFIQAGQ
ncbi:hypothetical protein VIGAN_03161200, partial [Vigna angularis var. angularis]